MDDLKPHQQIAIMSRWYVVSRCLHVMASLDIANHMSDTPTAVEDIAAMSNTNQENLERMLNFLSSYNVVNADGESRFSLTELSATLRDDNPNSMKEVLCMVDDAWWQAFAQLEQSIKIGDSAFKHQHDCSFFEFLQKDPHRQANFDKGMARLSDLDDALIAKSFDFSRYSSIADLGAGRGGLSQQLAKRYPTLSVTLFDTQAVIDLLKEKPFPSNVKLVVGNFFESLPTCDSYLFKGVLHDFNDEDVVTILKNCYNHLSPQADLFIAEQVLPETPDPHPNKTMDMVMLALLNGSQRTPTHWQQLIEQAGFIQKQRVDTDSLFSVLKLTRV